MEVLGVTVPNEKKILQKIKAELTQHSHREKIELAKALVASHIFECQHIAYEMLGKDKKPYKSLKKAT